MKRIICALAVGMMAAAAPAECLWTWWPGNPAENQKKDLSGCALGIGSKVNKLKSGAEVSLVYSATEDVQKGAQVTVLGLSKAKTVEKGAQAGLVSIADSVKKAAQVGFVNIADHAMVQVGLVCCNKDGFLPVFIFFNMATKK